MKDFLLALLKARVSQEGWSWLREGLQVAAEPIPGERFAACFTAASRKLGKQALLLTPEEKERLASIQNAPVLDHWGVDEAARAVLLLSLSRLEQDGYVETALHCYEQGDSREQQSWLRALGVMPHGERFVATATDACRTNIIPLFEAIACENPFPALYFPELNFNQMVLKSLFNGIAISRIVGLESRFNPELSRMANDYVSEREAARREVPADIWLALAPRIGTDHLGRVYGYLNHDDPRHRYWAAVGLGWAGDAESRDKLKERGEKERDPKVLEAIKGSLAKRVARG